MIKKMNLQGFGCLRKPVEVDFTFKNYSKNDYEDISEKKQVWNENGLSVVMALLGKNATGKTTFFTPIKLLKKFEEESFVSNMIYRLKYVINYFLVKYFEANNFDNNEAYSNEVFQQITKVSDQESGIYSFKVKKKLLDAKQVAGIKKEIIESFKLTPQFWVSQNVTSLSEEKAVFNFETEENTYKYVFTKENIFKIEENKEKSFNEIFIEYLMPKIEENEQEILIDIATKKFQKAINDFSAPVTKNINMLSLNFRSRISENNGVMLPTMWTSERDGTKEVNISYIIGEIVESTSFEFIKGVLQSIDPMISSVKGSGDTSDLENFRKKNVDIFLKDQEMPINANLLSSGTKHFLIILRKCLEAISKGMLVMIDELDNGLQIRLAQLLIELFVDENINENKAQILFTTHSINYIGKDIIHQKNHIISYRDENSDVVFEKYDQLLSRAANVKREITRSNINKFYFDETLFKDETSYPFMITKKERDAIIKKLALKSYNEN